MFQAGQRREQPATVTVNMAITGRFVTDIRNATSVAATVPAAVRNSKHYLVRRQEASASCEASRGPASKGLP